jgi:hypothetical protein
MARVHDHMRRLMRGEQLEGRPFPWQHVLGLLHALSIDDSPDTERVLEEAAGFEGEVVLDPGPGMPHSMPPVFLIRALAVQLLARRYPGRHRTLFRKIARTAHSERLREVARAYLTP